MLHVPVLRGGRPYRSLETTVLAHVATGQPLARMSLANPGLIARDLGRAGERRRELARVPIDELLSICARAAELYIAAELPIDPDAGPALGPDEFVRLQSSSTGLPERLCRANMEKTRFVLAEMRTVLGGLTRGVDLAVFDAGFSHRDGRMVSYVAETDTLGAVLPSNSPGVHSLWLPAVAMKVPLTLKPGRQEPWTPLRVLAALVAAGCPEAVAGFYPTSYAGANEILLRTGRSMLFGDESTVRPWRDDPRVQLHGPGWSKVLLDADRARAWSEQLDLLVTSVAENGGRSCLNASGVWTAACGREIAEALAERLARIEARALDDPQAALAAFPSAQAAEAVSAFIDRQLEVPGAIDLTAPRRGGQRVARVGGCSFVLPTVIWCEDPEHPLARCELLFPFVSVVEVPQSEMLGRIGTTLVATALTEDRAFAAELMAARHIDRLNLGPVPTSRVSWDQPHEGNLFEHLYRQRALQSFGFAQGVPTAPAAPAA